MIFPQDKPRTFKVISSSPKNPKVGDTIIYTVLDKETNIIYETEPALMVSILDKKPEWGPLKDKK